LQAPRQQVAGRPAVENPNGGEAVVHRSPEEIIDEIAALDAESAEVLTLIRKLI